MAIGFMALTAWFLSAYYTMRNTQGFFQDGFDSKAHAAAYGETMLVLTGATLATTSEAIKALAFVLNSFNDFMDDWFGSDSFLEEFGEITSTGKLEIPDINVYFPNGMVVEIVKGKQLQEFRFDITATSWKGFHVEVNAGSSLTEQNSAPNWATMGVYLTQDPNFEFVLPGSDQLLFVDPLDGVTRKGDLCTPRQGINDADVALVTAIGLYLDIILKALKASGASKTIESFGKFIYSKRLNVQIRNKLEDIFDSVDVILDSVGVVQQEVDLSDEMNKDFLAEKPTFVKKLQRFQYRPYG